MSVDLNLGCRKQLLKGSQMEMTIASKTGLIVCEPIPTTLDTPVESLRPEDGLRQRDRPWHCHARGEFIPLSKNGAWKICRGWIQLSTIAVTGEERILGWFGASAWLTTWLTGHSAHQAKALSDTVLVWYSRKEIENSPKLCQSLLPQTGKQLRQIESLLATLKHKRVEDRLYQLLYLLKQEMGEPVAGGIRLAARLTHEDLANAIGTCRVTVTRSIGKLKQQGQIEIDPFGHLILRQIGMGYSTVKVEKE